MSTRREFLHKALKAGGCLGLLPLSACVPQETENSLIVNDIHSQLNSTRLAGLAEPTSTDELKSIFASLRAEKKPFCIAGGRHSMGGQQFGMDAVLIDTRQMNRVLDFDWKNGAIEIEAGLQWPELVDYLVNSQEMMTRQQLPTWGIRQKQTGADRLCLGGALSSNVHGRGLKMPPIVNDVEWFELLDAQGKIQRCSRQENAELFRLAIGGYGLFGIITKIRLRLMRRQKVQRVVKILDVENVMDAFNERIKEGFLYGDFQYSIDEKSPGYLQEGVFSCYRPVAPQTVMPEKQKQVSEQQWHGLLLLAHTDKKRAYELYRDYYLSSSGQIYWSDDLQLSAYLDDYHKQLDYQMNAPAPATEVITEIYVPRAHLADFMREAAQDFLKNDVNVIYGTVRLIEPDKETFLAWAKQNYACVIFNLHTVHTPEGQEHSAQAFRRLIDMAIKRDGSYYLTYHRHATREQVLACYPQFPEFLRAKLRYDPHELWQSDWYRHYRALFKDALV